MLIQIRSPRFRSIFAAMMQNRCMTGQRLDLLVRLEQDVTDRSVPLADLLRTCIVLGGRTGSNRLSEWTSGELKGYPDQALVPAYRVLTAPILIKTYIRATGKTEKDTLHDHNYSLKLREPIDRLDAIAAHSEASGKPFKIAVEKDIIKQYTRPLYKFYFDLRQAPPEAVESMKWLIDAPLVRGVLGQIRTALAEFIVELRAEVGDGDELPSARQTDRALQVALPAAVFTNSTVTIMTTGKGDIMPDDDRTIIRDNKTTIRGSSGNVSVASAKVAQINREAFDITRIKEFAGLIRQVSPILGFTSDQETELQAAADDLTDAADSSVPDVGRIRRLLDGALRLLRTVGPSAAGKLAISMGDELIRELGGEVIRDLPH